MPTNRRWRIKGHLAKGAAPSYDVAFQIAGTVTIVDGVPTPSTATELAVPVRLRRPSTHNRGDRREQFPGVDDDSIVLEGWLNHPIKHKWSLWPELAGQKKLTGSVTYDGQAGKIEVQRLGSTQGAELIGERFRAVFKAD